MVHPRDFSVVVPTFGRHEILVDTVRRELSLQPPPASVIVVDQNSEHPPEVERQLQQWEDESRIVRIRQEETSQSVAMNTGLREARTDYVIYHDDDVAPCPGLIQAYADAFNDMAKQAPECACVVGQVIQPEQQEIDYAEWNEPWMAFPSFPFNSRSRRFVEEAAAGNLCVHRERALELGGFDENFVGAAHKCDTEFALRLIRDGGRVLFEPKASILHLRAPHGGVRTYGNHLQTWKPHYPVGSYYLAMLLGTREAIGKSALLLFRSITTRHHLRRPWYMGPTIVSNLLALGWAVQLRRRGPALIKDFGSSAWNKNKKEKPGAAALHLSTRH